MLIRTPATFPSGRTEWTYLPRGNSTSTAGRNPDAARDLQKAPPRGAFAVRPRGLEPPRELSPTRPSTLRVYQFRHRRGAPVYPWGLVALCGGQDLVSVREPRYISEHVFDVPGDQAKRARSGRMDLTKRQ